MAWNKGGVQERINGVTLAVIHYIGNRKPEEATYCTERNPIRVIQTPTHPHNFQSKIYSVYKYPGIGEGAETEGMAIH